MNDLEPDLIASLRLYSTHESGRTAPIRGVVRCPSASSKVPGTMMHSVQFLLGDQLLHPGEQQELGFRFLTEEGAALMRAAGTFYLWDGQFFAEATIVE